MTSPFLNAEILKNIDNSELTFVLNNLVSIEKTKTFPEQGFEVRIYKTSSYSHCAAALNCLGNETLYVASTEGKFDEGAIENLYKLPSADEWVLIGWSSPMAGWQILNLTAKRSGKVNSYELKINYLKAELTAL
jgi:hypothetical protein